MTRFLTTMNKRKIACLTLALSGLFVASGPGPTNADGVWVFGSYVNDPHNLPSYITTPGAYANMSFSGVGSGAPEVTALANFSNSPGEELEAAEASYTTYASALWEDLDGKTLYATHGFYWTIQQSVGGVTGPVTATNATSGATSGSLVVSQCPYPNGYPSPTTTYNDLHNTVGALTPNATIKGNIEADVAAGPDISSDPNTESNRNPSQATAQAQLSLGVIDGDGTPV